MAWMSPTSHNRVVAAVALSISGNFYANDTLHAWNGAHLTDGGTWTSASDRDKKENFVAIDAREILARAVALPVMQWSYKAEPGIKRIGPVAQDFYAAFGLGTDDKGISTVDEGGVALAAIQGLNAKVEEQQHEIAELRRIVLELRGAMEVKAAMR
jgi:endosialidase-like protein